MLEHNAFMSVSDTWQAALDERDDLKRYAPNAVGLFALVLHFGLEDIESVATDAIVDGSDDKKCDIVYIDRGERAAVIAQCFESQKRKTEAPANKASDLSTAVGWLLNAEVENHSPKTALACAKPPASPSRPDRRYHSYLVRSQSAGKP
jgi:hypothetical protein